MSSSKAATLRKTSSRDAEAVPAEGARRATTLTSRVGRLVGRAPDGSWIVDYPGNVHGPLHAPALAQCAEGLAATAQPGTQQVLLVFDDGDARAPVIVGALAGTSKPTLQVLSVCGQPAQVQIDGDTLVLRAQRSIRIECGESTLALHADGTVLIKGRKLVSRASESNRIRGSTVSIN